MDQVACFQNVKNHYGSCIDVFKSSLAKLLKNFLSLFCIKFCLSYGCLGQG